MKQIQTQLGTLDAVLVDDLDDGGRPDLAVILCHGFGAPATDLVGLGAELLRVEPTLRGRVRFVFPGAPLSLDALGMWGGRAWWHLDMAKIEAAMASGEIRDLRDDQPAGLPAARRALMGLIEAVLRQTGLPMSKVVLGGFSQGAMLTTDVALRLEEAPAALVVMSGTLLSESEWRKRAPTRRGLKVLQSHGTLDPLLPFAAAEWLRDLMVDAGMDVTFLPFQGPHTIPMEMLRQLGELLRAELG